MSDTSAISWFDIAVVAVVLVSALLAYLRGFAREVLSLLSWVAATAVSAYGYEPVLPFVQKVVTVEIFAKVATIAGLFVLTLIVCSVISSRLTRVVANSSHGALDRSLGLLFGLFRGVLLVSVGFLVLSLILADSETPPWLQASRTAPVLEVLSKQIQTMLPEHLAREGRNTASQARDRARQALETQRLWQQFNLPTPVAGEGRHDARSAAANGYRSEERRQMEQLLQQSTQ